MLRCMWMILSSSVILGKNIEKGLSKFCFGSNRDFLKAKVIYLEHVVGHGAVTPIKAKIKSINDYPISEYKKSSLEWWGIIENFAKVTAPLTELLKKGVKYHWSEACQKSFDKVKTLLCLEPVLTAPNFNKPFRLAVDASDVGAGAVLLQSDDKDIEHPICYFSRKFIVHQKNYSTIEKECLALILVIQHFNVYISSSSKPTVVYTYHNPLVFLHKMKNKHTSLLNWSLMLQEYNLQIEHVKGKDNICADALSSNYV